MKLKDRVALLVSKDEQKQIKEIDWYAITHSLCSRYKWSLETLQRQPIPFIYSLQLAMAEEKLNELKQNTEAKKQRRKPW